MVSFAPYCSKVQTGQMICSMSQPYLAVESSLDSKEHTMTWTLELQVMQGDVILSVTLPPSYILSYLGRSSLPPWRFQDYVSFPKVIIHNTKHILSTLFNYSIFTTQ